MSRFNTPFKLNEKAGTKAKAALADRLKALRQFRPNEPVVINGGISAIFVRADTALGNAIVQIGNREQPVNPLNIQPSSKKK